jgi:hypothetical protein
MGAAFAEVILKRLLRGAPIVLCHAYREGNFLEFFEAQRGFLALALDLEQFTDILI